MNAQAPSPMLAIGLESWPRFAADAEPLWQRHYEEFRPFHQDRMPYGPDKEMYGILSSRGHLLIATARWEGELVGYFLLVARRHPHYLAICGFEDSLYLAPEHRKGLAGGRLISTGVREFHNLWAKAPIYCYSKMFKPYEKLLVWLGFEQADSVWVLWPKGE